MGRRGRKSQGSRKLLHLPLALGRVLGLLDARQPAEKEAHGQHERLVGEAGDEGLDGVEGGAAPDELADLVEDEADEEEEAHQPRAGEEDVAGRDVTDGDRHQARLDDGLEGEQQQRCLEPAVAGVGARR